MAIIQPSNCYSYDGSNLTKGVEQRQHAAQATAGDFLFDLDKLRQTHQKSYFLQTMKTNPDWYNGLWLSYSS